MADHLFFAAFPGDLAADDQARLHAAHLTAYENRVGVTHPVWRAEDAVADARYYQVIRVVASNAEEARKRVVEVLGRQPEGLEIGT